MGQEYANWGALAYKRQTEEVLSGNPGKFSFQK